MFGIRVFYNNDENLDEHDEVPFHYHYPDAHSPHFSPLINEEDLEELEITTTN